MKIQRWADPNSNRGGWNYWCPGCQRAHSINDSWVFNNNADCPTFSPSILVTGTVDATYHELELIKSGEKVELKSLICHCYIKKGKIEFLGDCTHDLKGQTVELPDWPYGE